MENQELYYDENFEVVTKPRMNQSNSLENEMIAMGKALVRAKKCNGNRV